VGSILTRWGGRIRGLRLDQMQASAACFPFCPSRLVLILGLLCNPSTVAGAFAFFFFSMAPNEVRAVLMTLFACASLATFTLSAFWCRRLELASTSSHRLLCGFRPTGVAPLKAAPR
jgi:hypothetical protein